MMLITAMRGVMVERTMLMRLYSKMIAGSFGSSSMPRTVCDSAVVFDTFASVIDPSDGVIVPVRLSGGSACKWPCLARCDSCVC